MKSHKIRVILADDHPVVRDGLAAIVNQQADMEVVAEAGDGDEAITLYEQHRPDVMVLDLRMPKRDGVAVVQRVLDVLQLVAEGRSNKDIARRLSITEGTAKTHVKAILTKLDAISRTEAVAVAHKRGLIHL